MVRTVSSARNAGQPNRAVRRNTTPADWGEVSPELMAGAVVSVTSQGGALRFGYTRDGGAYAVGVLGDGEPRTDYVRPNEDVEAYLRELIAIWSE